MSQVVGLNFKSRIPTFGDDASIEEALRVYHYGIDNYSSQQIPDDSIEGNFRSLDSRIDTLESNITAILASYIKRVSDSSNPNTVTAQTTTTVPLTVKAISLQTSNLQQWQDSSTTVVARMSTGGSFAAAGYLSVGSSSFASSVAASISIGNSSHKGIIVKSTSGQSANLQEWQDSSGAPLSWVDSSGNFYINGDQIETKLSSLMLMGA